MRQTLVYQRAVAAFLLTLRTLFQDNSRNFSNGYGSADKLLQAFGCLNWLVGQDGHVRIIAQQQKEYGHN